MKLHVKNFGPIREAKVEIRPMTVFVGHSNTGKSYLAMLVYSITKTFAAAAVRESFVSMFPKITPPAMQKEAAVDASDIGDLFDGGYIRPGVEIATTAYLGHIKKMWARQASFCFGEEWENIAKPNFSFLITDEINKITLDLCSDKDDFKVPKAFVDKIMRTLKTKLEKKLEEKRAAVLKGKPKEKELHQISVSFDVISEMFDADSPGSILNVIMDSFNFSPSHVDDYSDKKIQNKIHYLPAGRGIFMESHLPIANAIMHNPGVVYSDKIPFNGIVLDFLQKLLSVKESLNISDERKKMAVFADKMEKRIAKGRIKLRISEAGYPHFSYAFENFGQGDIPLTVASSAVSELASVILFIRHYLSPGDVFIVEEPEASLHTVAQREIAALLVELVNAGVYVFITTHSDVILEQISNCMQASRLPKGSKTKVLHNAKLAPEKINVYTFVERKLGTKVQLVPPDEEDLDILSEDHTDVSSDLYNESVRIYNTIQENGD